MNYHGMLLPHLPVNIECKIKLKLLQAKQNEDCAKYNAWDSCTMQYFQTFGSHVWALYGNDKNPVTWYKAVVDQVITKDESGAPLPHPKFVVTFSEYGNTETVTPGEIDMPENAGGAASRHGRPEAQGDGGGVVAKGVILDMTYLINAVVTGMISKVVEAI
jgi:pre-mRNA-splicing factor 38B